MRSIWAAAILLMCAATTAIPQSSRNMEDPLFGIVYDPQVNHFESEPSSLLKMCPDLQHRYTTAWIFGHFKMADSEYFLISGLMMYRDNATGKPATIAPDEAGGVAIALRGSRCLVDQTDYFLTQKTNPARGATPIVAPQSVLKGLLRDAFNRYATALGGRQHFLMQVNPDAIGPPIVREELEVFKKSG